MSQQGQEFEGKQKEKQKKRETGLKRKMDILNSEADEVVAHSPQRPPECPHEQTDSGSIFPRLFRHP